MLQAIVRRPSPRLAQCALTHLEPVPIDAALAARQHEAYCAAVRAAGAQLLEAPPAPELPDGVFVEDCLVALPELAIVTRPGVPSRAGETQSLAGLLEGSVALPRGRLDGGDVLRLGRTLYIGVGGRTDADGIAAIEELVAPWGYRVEPVALKGCLHLKTAVTQVQPGIVALNPQWVDSAVFAGYERIEVDPDEPFGANVLVVGETVLSAAAAPRTAARFPCRTVAVDISEFAKAEAGLTCMSVIVG